MFTLEVWYKRNRAATDEFLICKGTGAYGLRITTGNKLQLTRFATADIVESTVDLTNDGVFHHLVATKSGATVKLYIDGIDRTGTVSDSTMANTASTFAIGSQGVDGSGGYCDGWYDEVAVYPTALSSERVKAHWNVARSSRRSQHLDYDYSR